jgi:beta-lactamase regulating signal transducer with metallopeptidase domain
MLSNAAIAAVLALVALVVGRTCRSPAVRHAAWVVVLLKLVTPPLISIPLPVLPPSWGPDPEEPPAEHFVLVSPTVPVTGRTPVGAIAPGGWGWYRPAGAAEWAVVVWAAGAAAWFAWQGRRIARFRRRVAGAADAPPDLAAAANRLAAALGIARPPGVKLAPGIGSPMLWGWGREAIVLFPRDLLPRLSADARDTLLAHELAHYLRRDHWVRILEFVASGLYWWHPVVWVARRRLEAAEEQCCDSWVVGGLAVSPRLYAEALLATVDFEAELRRPRLPPGACGVNRSARLLQRRLLGLIRADHPHRLRVARVLRTVIIVALLIRPVLRAATPDPVEPPVEPVVVEPPCPRPVSPLPTRKAPAEPRAWASATAPGRGLSVVARDREVLLRFPDGSSRVLGPGRPLALAFAPGGGRLATVGPGPLVRLWDDHGELRSSARVAARAVSLTYTPDGTHLLVLDTAGGITVHDPRTLTIASRWSVESHANTITCAPDNRTVAVACGSWRGEAGWVELWSIPDRRQIASYPASAPVGATRFTPDGGTLVIGSWSGLVAWRSMPAGDLRAEHQCPKDVVAGAAFSPDADTLPLEPPPPEPARPGGLTGPDAVDRFGTTPER